MVRRRLSRRAPHAILANGRSLRHNRDVLPTPSASPPKTVWAVLDVLRWTTAHFEKHGVASARLDAELLAAHAFGMSRIELYAHFDRPWPRPSWPATASWSRDAWRASRWRTC